MQIEQEFKNEKFILTLDELKAGWAYIIFKSGNICIRVEASDVLYDTLSDLVEIAIKSFNGYDCIKSVSQELSSSADEISIETKIKPCKNIELKIGETVITCSLQRYARQVLKLFNSYKYEHGINEYYANWAYLFPEKNLEILKKLLCDNEK